MKYVLRFIAFLFVFSSFNANSQTASDMRAVPAYVTIKKATPSITLHWSNISNATAFVIYKRSLGDGEWGDPIISLARSVQAYEDKDVTNGIVYEYKIEKTSTTPDPLGGGNITGYGYVSAVIEKPVNHKNGIMWVLIAKNINDSLSKEIVTLESDLVGDGWDVHMEVVNETATFKDVKTFILYQKNNNGCDAVYLLGNVPVPYSGSFCVDFRYAAPPDGHTPSYPPSHCGAWPADVFYGVTGGRWSDYRTDTSGARSQNKNFPEDDKYDNNRIPDTVSIAIGRVDFSNLPALSMSEVELTRQYLGKVHSYKIGKTRVLKNALIENNFSAFSEGFSSGAIRDFTSIAGENNLVYDDVLTASRFNDYLFSYICGGGTYSSCGGVGVSSDFNTKNMAAFNHMFGSYFGDYDTENNFMRSSMASKKLGLVSIWSGRPKWVTHTLAIGENYGDIVLRSQNNWQDYDANFYQNCVQINLLGDPSLRIDMLAPVSNLNLTTNSSKSEIDVSWAASTGSGFLGYYVYRSSLATSNYALINDVPMTITSYKDTDPLKGTNHYMVRSVYETNTGSGSYLNLSLGTTKSIEGIALSTGVSKAMSQPIAVYPTIVSSSLNIDKADSKLAKYQVINSLGSLLKEGFVTGTQSSIDVGSLPEGSYIITIESQAFKFIKH